MKDLISVIINTYNAQNYIDKCIQSIISQTYKNIEIIIVNDGSTDNTLNICKKYKDNRIKIIDQENKGLSLARNIGIENSNGKYLYFVDADDYVENDVLEYLYNQMKKYKVLIATCDSVDIYDYQNKVKNKAEKIEIVTDKQMIKDILFSKKRVGAIWNKLFDKTLFENIRFENRIINDVVVVYKLLLQAKKIVISNQIKYYYLRHNESITSNNKDERLIDFYEGSLERFYYIKNIYQNFLENEIGLCLIIIYIYIQDKNKVNEFLKEKDAITLFNKLFSLKFFIRKIGIKNKLKILLFRISPKFYKFLYKNIKERIKKDVKF